VEAEFSRLNGEEPATCHTLALSPSIAKVPPVSPALSGLGSPSLAEAPQCTLSPSPMALLYGTFGLCPLTQMSLGKGSPPLS
jgi:hypothetical protein